MKLVALLRGINVGGTRKIPMSELSSIVTKAGFHEVRTCINSGNILLDAGKGKPAEIEALLEEVIEKRFGFRVDVIVRTAAEWKKYAAGSPFPDAQKARPNFLLLGLSKHPCHKELLEKLEERATQGERIKLAGGAIWVDFVAGVGKSKLTPAIFDKAAGSPVTMRNWNTVLRLNEMLLTAAGSGGRHLGSSSPR